jgi:hypothetical protein
VAAVACTVGTPGVQRAARRGRSAPRGCTGTARVACHRRHPATQQRRCGVPPCGAALPWADRCACAGRLEHPQRRFTRSAGACRGRTERRNTGTLLRRLCISVGLRLPHVGRAGVASAVRWRAVDFVLTVGGRFPCQRGRASFVLGRRCRVPLCCTGWRVVRWAVHVAVGTPERRCCLFGRSAFTLPCRGVRRPRLQPPWAVSPRFSGPRRLAISPLQRWLRLRDWLQFEPFHGLAEGCCDYLCRLPRRDFFRVFFAQRRASI